MDQPAPIDHDASGSGPGVVALLRRNRSFRRLWTARAISFTGDSLGLMALLLYVAEEIGTGASVAMLLLVGDVAPTLLSPLTGALCDRLDRTRLMVVCDLLQGAVVAAIALTSPPLALLLALVALRSTLAGIFQPASRSAVPALVRDSELEAANTALGLGTNGFDLLGPLLAAALLPFMGIREVLLVDAASFAVSALLLTRLPSLAPARLESERGTLWGDAVAGLRFFRDHRALRVVGLGFLGVVAFGGVDDVALVFLAQDSLGAGETGTSLLYAGAGIGLLLGFLVLARMGILVPAALLTVAGFAISSAGNLFTGLAWALPVALAMQVVRGAGISLIDVGVNTLVQRLVPSGMQGRAFGNLYGAVGLAAGLSYVFGGLLLDAIGPRAILAIAGGGGVAVALVTWLALPEELRRRTSPAGVADEGLADRLPIEDRATDAVPGP